MADIIRHEARITDKRSWDNTVECECGERCANWIEFWRHRGDAYLEALRTAKGDT